MTPAAHARLLPVPPHGLRRCLPGPAGPRHATLGAGARWAQALFAAVLLLAHAALARAGDWPMANRDASRSNVTDETLAPPLALLWRHAAAQPPAPAWPEPVKNLNRTDFDYAPVPVAADGRLFFGSSADDTVRALDAATGKPLWQFTTAGPVRFAPHVAQGRVYVGSDDGRVYCLDAASGKVVWSFRGGPSDDQILGNGRLISRWPIRTGVLVDASVVYFAAGMWPAEGVFLWALDAPTGKPIWCNDTAGATGVRVVGHVTEQSLSGITPQGLIAATADKLVVPMGRSAPATFDRATGALLQFHPGDANGFGGSWITLDGDQVFAYSKSFYSGLAIGSLQLDTLDRPTGTQGQLKLVQTPSLNVPQNGVFLRGLEYSVYDGKVSAIIKNRQLTARMAYSLARASDSLVLGYDGAVAIEGSTSAPAAVVRIALAGDHLALHASVVDRRVAQDPVKPWTASCFEIFAAPPGKGAIGQVMFIPAVGAASAAALISQGGKPTPAPQVRVHTTATDAGYELEALIPLATLGLDAAAAEMMLEFQVTAASPSGRLNRDTLFGSPLAYQNREKFGRFAAQEPGTDLNARQLMRMPAPASPNLVKAALAKLPSHAIRVSEQRELWRAPVSGKAYALAVADGRLFVATDRGEISCFGPAPVSPSQPPAAAQSASPRLAPTDAPPAAHAQTLAKIRGAGMDLGYALVLGDTNAQLAQTLATRTRMHVILLDADAAVVDRLRRSLLTTTSLYGSRIHAIAIDDLGRLPLARYMANAVIVAAPVRGIAGAELYRVLRPAGGVLLVPGLNPAQAAQVVAASKAMPAEITGQGADLCVIRDRLEGALDWDRRMPGDALVRWPLRPLWFGGTGPAKTHNRKYQGQPLTAAAGRYFENGESHITAVDAYNGFEWWSKPKPLQVHGGYQSSIQADDKHVYFTLTSPPSPDPRQGLWGCIVLDARTGQQQRIYTAWKPAPQVVVDKPQSWEMRPAIAAAPGGQGAQAAAAPAASTLGRLSITRDETALTLTLTSRPPQAKLQDQWSLCFDFRPPAQRLGLYEAGVWQYRIATPTAAGEPASWRPGTGESHPPLTVEGSRQGDEATLTVRLRWANVPGLEGKAPASLGFAANLRMMNLSLAAAPIAQAFLFGDELADGLNNGWANLLLDPSASRELATQPPMIAGTLEGQPAAQGMDLGEPLPKAKWQASSQRLDMGLAATLRTHPLTGQKVEKVWIRGDGCAPAFFSAAASLSRAANAGIYDYVDDSGMRTFGGVRLSCGNASMASQGVWYIANGGSGCECTYAFLSQVALAQADRRLHEDWALFADWRVDTRVRQAALNLGAPGDRRDDAGALWLGFPRPLSHRSSTQSVQGAWAPFHGVWQQATENVLPVPLELKHLPGGGPYRVSADRVAIAGTDRPWIYASQARGVSSAVLTLNHIRPMVASAAGAPITVNGKLDDAAWKGDPQARLKMSQSSVWFRYDDQNLYIAGRRDAAVDRRGDPRKWSKSAGKEITFMGDVWEVFLSDSRNKKVIHLAVDTAGVRRAAVAAGPEQERVGLPLAWESAAEAVDGEAFVAEFAIPWSTLAAQGIDKDALCVNAQVGDHPLVAEALVRLGGQGRARCANFAPLGLGRAPTIPSRRYTVRLHFAELEDVAPGRRIFDVKLQGQVVIKALDVVKEAGGPRRALVRQFEHVVADDALTLEFVPAPGATSPAAMPILSALELMEEEPQGNQGL